MEHIEAITPFAFQYIVWSTGYIATKLL